MNDERTGKGTKKMADARYNMIHTLIDLLDEICDFTGFPELESYLDYYKKDAVSHQLSLAKHYLLRFCIYRLTRELKCKELKEFDCDCSREATEFYQDIYSWLRDYVCETQYGTIVKYQLRHPDKDMVFKGDTMTSVFTPLKGYIKLKNNIYSTSSKTEDWEVFWIKNMDTFDISEAAGDFIAAAHTCGNFLPVPQGFNRGRSNYGKWDSWDLTLQQIYKWYMDNPTPGCITDNSALEQLFQHAPSKASAILYCVKWLKTFDSWMDFTEKNYMASFLGKDQTPLRFFENHTLEYGLPKTLEEYEEFFRTAAACIQKRGEILWEKKCKS